jgi:serine/threonine-protein kinase RsbW
VTEPAVLRLRMPAEAENVALVRQALSGMAESIGMDAHLLADMKTTVTEACNNVVVHAYPDSAGALEVEVRPNGRAVRVIVRDFGSGMQPRSLEPEHPSLGLGLPLIAALSNSFEIRGGSGRGIEIDMGFAIGSPRDELYETSEEDGDREQLPSSPSEKPGGAVSVTATEMLGPVLGRVAAMLAARSDFSLDRLSDAVLVTDAISAHVSTHAPGGSASVELEEGDGSLGVRVGPLVEGGAEELLRSMELPGLERSLHQLADDIRVEREAEEQRAEGEYLELRIAAGTGQAANAAT